MTSNTEPELLPCPFCGSEAEYKLAYGVICIGCGAKVPCTFDDVNTAWNTRSTPTKAEPTDGALETDLIKRLRVGVDWQNDSEPNNCDCINAASNVMDEAADALAERDARIAELEAVCEALEQDKAFAFDPAQDFIHADDGGAPEHAHFYVPRDEHDTQLATARNDALEAISTALDDIPTTDGFCDWADVANARDQVIRALKSDAGEW